MPSGFPPGSRIQTGQAIDDPFGHLALVEQGKPFDATLAIEQRDLVGLAAETRPRSGGIVEHDEVAILRLELGLGTGELVPGFEGEANDLEPGASRQGRKDVSSGLQLEREGAVPALELVARGR